MNPLKTYVIYKNSSRYNPEQIEFLEYIRTNLPEAEIWYQEDPSRSLIDLVRQLNTFGVTSRFIDQSVKGGRLTKDPVLIVVYNSFQTKNEIIEGEIYPEFINQLKTDVLQKYYPKLKNTPTTSNPGNSAGNNTSPNSTPGIWLWVAGAAFLYLIMRGK